MIEVSDIKEVLNSILTNPDYVSDEVIKKAIEDTKEIIKQRELETPFVLDIAIKRVFIRSNLEIPKSVEKAYNEAVKRLKEVPIKTTKGSFNCIVSKRNTIWI